MTHPLLTPRYMVEADYPNSPYEVGDILLNYKDTHYRRVSDGYVFTEQKIQNYPHIFRPMHWSEQRELGEMPKYVWYEGAPSKVTKLVCVEGESGETIVTQTDYDGKGLFNLDNQYMLKGFSWREVTPATEAEYLEYLKSKEK